MGVFKRLAAIREFEKKHLPFLETMEDVDLVIRIGAHEEKGRPIILKHLLLDGVASIATVQRRLRRLKRLGVIHQRRSRSDGRVVHLTISPRIRRIYNRYSRLLARDARAVHLI